MLPDSETSETTPAQRAPKLRKPRGRRKVAEGHDQPVARVLQLVAAIKAERWGQAGEGREVMPVDRAGMFAALRRLLSAREQERGEWRHQVARIEGELGAARSAADQLRAELEQTAAQHRRALADLKLLHEHQRSIWQLERRRLEITVEACEQARRYRLPARLLGFVQRPAALAALLLVSLAALALARDSGAAASGIRLYLDDARAFFLAARSELAPASDAIDGNGGTRIVLPPR